jgi:hypothetical protein
MGFMNTTIRIAILLFIVLYSGALRAHDSWNTTLLGYCGPDTSLDIAISEPYVYVVDGAHGLHILDITDPIETSEIGSCSTPGWAWDVSINGNYAYVLTADSGVRIIDVSDPTDPIEIGSVDVDSVQNIAFKDNYAYLNVAGSFGIVDISDPVNPAEIEYYIPPSHEESNILDIAIRGNYAFVIFYWCVISVDISDPGNPIEMDHLSDYGFYSWSKKFTIQDTYAFMTVASDLGPDWFSIATIDLSDLPNMGLLEHLQIDSLQYPVDDLVVSDSYVYVVNTGDGLRILDISDPTNPVGSGSYIPFDGMYNPENKNNVAISGNAIFMTGGIEGTDGSGGVYIIQNDLAVSRDEAYIIPGIFVLDQNFPNPFNPTTTISFDLSEQSTISLTVYNVQGWQITTLQNGIKSAGFYDVQWHGVDNSGSLLSTGVYFCRLQAGDYSQTIKMVYLR